MPSIVFKPRPVVHVITHCPLSSTPYKRALFDFLPVKFKRKIDAQREHPDCIINLHYEAQPEIKRCERNEPFVVFGIGKVLIPALQ